MTATDEKLMSTVSSKLKFRLRDRLLVKPLKPIMVTITQEVPVFDKDEKGEVVKDEHGIPTYSKTEKETKRVPSSYCKGFVLKVPYNLKDANGNEQFDIKVGDTILYPTNNAIPFDQLKDSVFVSPYHVVAIYEEDEQKN